VPRRKSALSGTLPFHDNHLRDPRMLFRGADPMTGTNGDGNGRAGAGLLEFIEWGGFSNVPPWDRSNREPCGPVSSPLTVTPKLLGRESFSWRAAMPSLGTRCGAPQACPGLTAPSVKDGYSTSARAGRLPASQPLLRGKVRMTIGQEGSPRARVLPPPHHRRRRETGGGRF